MEGFVQTPLPGMPLRVIMSAQWTSPTEVSTVRGTIDVPSDLFSSQISGTDVYGRMTLEEFLQAVDDVTCALQEALQVIAT